MSKQMALSLRTYGFTRSAGLARFAGGACAGSTCQPVGDCTYNNGGNLSGEGSPEGVVTASPGATYVDTLNRVLYFKVEGTNTNTGWA